MIKGRRRPALGALRKRGFDVLSTAHAEAILTSAFASELDELCSLLVRLTLPVSEIIGSGGGETKFTQRMRHSLGKLGWRKHSFKIEKTVDGMPRESISHEVDHVRNAEAGVIALEIEWNNKDPFFDRDLENFKRLHAEGAISVGVILTRGASLQVQMSDIVARFAKVRDIRDFPSLRAAGVEPTPKQRANIDKRTRRAKEPVPFAQAWVDNFVQNKFGAATTHWAKLIDRVDRGVGNPCPLLLIGLPASIVHVDQAKVTPLDDAESPEPDSDSVSDDPAA